MVRSSRLPLIECEVEGAEQLKRRGTDCLTVFLKPPSIETYESRLRASLTESEEEIGARLEAARRELAAAAAPDAPFDATIVNDDVEDAYAQLTKLIRCAGACSFAWLGWSDRRGQTCPRARRRSMRRTATATSAGRLAPHATPLCVTPPARLSPRPRP